jgi:2-keto-4-pentenoate hydratase/2-oxohepta-3-ene-1,7-dioic acid hydratase in catechol pathway
MRTSLLLVAGCLLGTGAVLWAADKPAAAGPRPGGPARFARFAADGRICYGLVERDEVREIEGTPFGDWKPTGRKHPLSEVRLLVPTQPSKVLALAVNYRSHAGTQPVSVQPEPFLKPPSCLLASGAPIVIPEGTARVDYEGELVIVIGRRAKNVSRDKALDHVLGVTCGNDVSARDWQKNDKQWWRAKGADTFGPCGPWIATGLNYDDLQLELRVNGQVRQKQRTRDMVTGVAEAVSFISRFVTLEPGDLIYTGTPGTTEPLHPGDVVEVEIEGVGILKNPVTGPAATDRPAVQE